MSSSTPETLTAAQRAERLNLQKKSGQVEGGTTATGPETKEPMSKRKQQEMDRARVALNSSLTRRNRTAEIDTTKDADLSFAVLPIDQIEAYRYLATASMSILRNQLRDFGYQVHETVLQAAEWNTLERRERMCMVALTKGISFDLQELPRPAPEQQCIGDVLDPIPHDDPCWSEMKGLKAKQERDRASGKGFAMQIVTADSTACPTITKGYAKVRSTDPKLSHPSNPDLLRQFTVSEHSRIKGIPDHLVSGLSKTVGHEVLGQSICYAPFEAVGQLVGKTLKRLKQV